MAKEVSVEKQRIINKAGKIVGYGLFLPSNEDQKKSRLKASATVILNVMTHMDIHEIATPDQFLMIDIDDAIVNASVLSLLDPKVFIFEIASNSKPSETYIKKLLALKKRGYRLALDDFDCSAKMVSEFAPLFKHLDIMKIDAWNCNRRDLGLILPKLNAYNFILHANHIDSSYTKKDFMESGFDLFQGDYIHLPELVVSESAKDLNNVIILHLIQLIKQDKETTEIETYLKMKPQVTYNLIKFLNNQVEIVNSVSSVTQVITLMGRDKLARWLLIYLFSEVHDTDVNQVVLDMALERAKFIEEQNPDDRDRAFMVGLFSLLDKLFETDIHTIFKSFKVDGTISAAILNKNGSLGKSLVQAEEREKAKIREIILNNFDQLDSADVAKVLEKANVKFE